MKYLADSNVFIEILLGQQGTEKCKSFLNDNQHNVAISDFTLHSIGVILNRHKALDVFEKFYDDIKEKIFLLSLPKDKYSLVVRNCREYNLDFDDAYQLAIAIEFKLSIVTQDKDFEKVRKDIDVIML